MGAETIRVEPAELRAAGKAVSKIGEKIGGDFGRAGEDGIKPGTQLRGALRSAAAARTLATLWRNYLSNLGKTVDGYGDRLELTAKAYQERDEEAAEALGVDLPVDPYVRPGRTPR